MLLRDFALLLTVCLVWASNFVVSKLAVGTLNAPPLFFSAARLTVVLLVVLPWLFPMPRPRWKIVVIGLLMGAGSFGLMNIGLMTATPSSAAVVVQLGVPTTSVLPLAGLSAAIEGPQIPIALNAGWALVAVVAYGGLAVSVLGHTLYFGLIQKYEANLVASLTLICPLMAVGLGVLVTGDHFDARMLFGTAIALAGVLLILLKPRKAAHLLSTVRTSMTHRP